MFMVFLHCTCSKDPVCPVVRMHSVLRLARFAASRRQRCEETLIRQPNTLEQEQPLWELLDQVHSTLYAIC